MRRPSPTSVLGTFGACQRWQELAEGKTWQQLFDTLRALDPFEYQVRQDWDWLATKLSWDCGCSYCLKASPAALGCLPLNAWLDALDATLSWRSR